MAKKRKNQLIEIEQPIKLTDYKHAIYMHTIIYDDLVEIIFQYTFTFDCDLECKLSIWTHEFCRECLDAHCSSTKKNRCNHPYCSNWFYDTCSLHNCEICSEAISGCFSIIEKNKKCSNCETDKILCKNCVETCEECDEKYCEECLDSCFYCPTGICKNCQHQCAICETIMCDSCSRGKNYCENNKCRKSWKKKCFIDLKKTSKNLE